MRPYNRIPEILGRAFTKLYDQLGYDSARLADPEIVGPLAAPGLRKASIYLNSLTLSSSIAAALASPFDPLLGAIILLAAISSLAAAQFLPHLWRSILAQGIDKELPALLVYLVPYSSSPKYLADVIAALPRGPFKWFTHEAARLKLLLDMGHDPLSALKRLAETTPSSRLRGILLEYTSLQAIGATSSMTTVKILERAIEMAREAWRGYVELSRAAVEIATAGLVSIVALAPLTGSTSMLVALIALLLASTGVLLLLARPGIGDGVRSKTIPAAYLASIGAASLLAARGGVLAALALLASSTIALEAASLRLARREARALKSLRVAAEEARYGLDYMDDLEEAKPLGGPISAVLEASRIAGSIGVGQALERLVRVLDEVLTYRKRAWTESIVLEGISMIAPVVLAGAIVKLSALLQPTAPLPITVPQAGVDAPAILALAPLATVPATTFRRGYRPTPLTGLITLLLVWLALKIVM